MSVFLFLFSLLEIVKGSRDSHNAKFGKTPHIVDSFGQTRFLPSTQQFRTHSLKNALLKTQKSFVRKLPMTSCT